MRGKLAGLALLGSIAAAAQTAEAPAFEVASIQASQPGREVIEAVPTSLTMRHVRLSNCIRWAYHVEEYQLAGADWSNDLWFEVWAKTATPVKEAELRTMLQRLLAERFKLSAHRQTKEQQTLVLTVGKNGHKLEPTETEGSPSFQTGKMNLTGKGATLSQLTEFLSHEMHTPILDQTGLTGKFNYFLDIGPYITEEIRKSGGPGGGPPPDAPSIIAQAIQAQLGLKVDAKKAPVEMVIIDHLEKSPTEN
jgi:uncharacterized protein (TIGR03435 family)